MYNLKTDPRAFQEEIPETLGTKEKSWFVDKSDDRYLYKIGRVGTGENWAEKVACELCGLLGIPHASYELAEYKNTQGILSPSFLCPTESLLNASVFFATMRPVRKNLVRGRIVLLCRFIV